MTKEMKKIKCPFCGHEQNIFYEKGASCKGLFFRCKARQCKREFEIKINPGK